MRDRIVLGDEHRQPNFQSFGGSPDTIVIERLDEAIQQARRIERTPQVRRMDTVLNVNEYTSSYGRQEGLCIIDGNF